MTSGLSDDNSNIAHEMGHNLHRRALLYAGNLTDGSCGSNGWGWTQSENDKCSTAEGWASFVGAATYFNPNAVAPWYANNGTHMEGLTDRGNGSNDLECVSNASSPHTRPGNVARFFWDLFDSTTDNDIYNGGYDNSSAGFSMYDLMTIWAEFPDGTADRYNEESGVDGRNAWDFEYWEGGAFSELNLNCLDGQTQ